MRLPAPAILAIAIVSSACATTYGPASDLRGGGYEESPLPGGEWLITVRANAETPPSRVVEWLHRRAGEIALRESCASYELVDVDFALVPALVGTVTVERPRAIGRLICK